MPTRALTRICASAPLRFAPLSRPAGEGTQHGCTDKRGGGEGAISAALSSAR